MTHEDMIKDFMKNLGQVISSRPTIMIGCPTTLLRIRLIAEEFGELCTAIQKGDLVEIADALADLEYVVVGTAVAFGIPHEAVFQEVHRSNMTKTKLDAHGKGGKEGYSKADIKGILEPLMQS